MTASREVEGLLQPGPPIPYSYLSHLQPRYAGTEINRLEI